MTLPGFTATRQNVSQKLRQSTAPATVTANHRPIAAALAVAGGLSLAAFPLLRPWGDKTGSAAGMMDAFASPSWVVSHSVGMLGFVLLAAAALVAAPVASSRAGYWLGAGVALILPFFGAETFGLRAVAVHFGDAAAAEVEALAALIREGAAQMTMFGIGLIAIAIGGALLARRNRAAILLAIALATYLPQFFFGAEVRIAHGLLLLSGALWWAWALWRAKAGTSESPTVRRAAAA